VTGALLIGELQQHVVFVEADSLGGLQSTSHRRANVAVQFMQLSPRESAAPSALHCVHLSILTAGSLQRETDSWYFHNESIYGRLSGSVRQH